MHALHSGVARELIRERLEVAERHRLVQAARAERRARRPARRPLRLRVMPALMR
jgi:hypothetical protein